MGSVAKSYMRKGFLIYEEMCKNLVIYEEAVSHIERCNCSRLNLLIFEEHFILFFISVPSTMSVQFLDRKYSKSLKEFLSKDDLESI
jgi:hypothetical protein